MSRDGGLRALFRQYMPEAHWQAVETWSTGSGVPDAEYCFPGGFQGWVEFKGTATTKVKIAPEQVAWLERRARAGGRAFLAVRHKALAGPRRKAVDALFLYRATEARGVLQQGLDAPSLGFWEGGPAVWDWHDIKCHLIKTT